MKALKCDCCGANGLVKEGEFYICDFCGTKYATQEFEKQIIYASVKIDNSEKIKNLYTLARRAKDENNQEVACKYYDAIVQEDPMSWEAAFYSALYRTYLASYDEVVSAIEQLSGTVSSVAAIVNMTVEEPQVKQIIAAEVFAATLMMCAVWSGYASGVFKRYKNGSNMTLTVQAMTQYYYISEALGKLMYKVGDVFQKEFFEIRNISFLIKSAWEHGNEEYETAIGLLKDDAKAERLRIVREYNEKIKDISQKVLEETELNEKEQAERAAKRHQKYWEEHAAEKRQLEAERDRIELDISALTASIDQVFQSANTNDVQQRIDALQKEYNALSCFKFKEKRVLNEKISAEKENLKSIERNRDREIGRIKEQLMPKQDRLNAINEELVKAR